MNLENFHEMIKDLVPGAIVDVDHIHESTQYRHVYRGTYKGVSPDGRMKVIGEPKQTERSYDSGVRYIHFSEIVEVKLVGRMDSADAIVMTNASK